MKGFRVEYRILGDKVNRIYIEHIGANTADEAGNKIEERNIMINVTKIELVDEQWLNLIRQLGGEG